MKLELSPEQQTKLRSVLHYNGLPIDARRSLMTCSRKRATERRPA